MIFFVEDLRDPHEMAIWVRRRNNDPRILFVHLQLFQSDLYGQKLSADLYPYNIFMYDLLRSSLHLVQQEEQSFEG